MFVASDDASETFAGLKRIHGLMPYFMLKAALKITNPVGMIRSTLIHFCSSLRSQIGQMYLTCFWRSHSEAVAFFNGEIF